MATDTELETRERVVKVETLLGLMHEEQKKQGAILEGLANKAQFEKGRNYAAFGIFSFIGGMFGSKLGHFFDRFFT